MTPISLSLPEPLDKASRKAAKHLGLSRAGFIRQAIAHELQLLQTEMQQKAMAKGFASMKKNKKYLKELAEIDAGHNALLPNEKAGWWK